MLKAGLRRVRRFFGAEILDELRALRTETASLNAKVSSLEQQLEQALLAIALSYSQEREE